MSESQKTNIDPTTGRALPKGVWYRGPSQYQARKMVDGKRIRKTFASAALARRWLNEKRAEIDLGQFRDTSAIDRIPIRQLIERYRDECMLHRENDRIGHIPALLDDPVASCMAGKWKPADVRGFRDRMIETGFAKGTVVKRLNLLASIIRHAVSEWDIHMDNNASAKIVKRPEGADKKRNRRLVGKEYDLILEAMSKTEYPDDVLIVRFAIEQGTRRGEAMALRWRDIDMKRNLLSLLQTKNMRTAKVQGPEIRPLMPGAKSILLEKLAMRSSVPDPEAHVFGVGSEDSFSLRFGRQIKKFGVHDLTFHDLRHEATSRLAKLFPNPMDLKRITGHRDLKSLDRYYQLDLSDLADRAAKQTR